LRSTLKTFFWYFSLNLVKIKNKLKNKVLDFTNNFFYKKDLEYSFDQDEINYISTDMPIKLLKSTKIEVLI